MVVSADQSVLSAVIITPTVDRKEGGQVQMRCTTTNFSSIDLEWMKDNRTLRRGEVTQTTNQRFIFDARNVSMMETIQEFNITDLQRDDAGEYVCNIYNKTAASGSNILKTASVMLSVLYFPNESFPICSPDGSITVDSGTELNMQCSSESGYPEVKMDICQSVRMNTCTWSSSSSNDTVLMLSNMTVDISDKDVQFTCTISSSVYFRNMNRSCTIGPIKVMHMVQPSATIAGAVAGAVAGGVVAFLLIVILIVICRRRLGLCQTQRKSPNSTLNPNLANAKSTIDEAQHSAAPNFVENAGLEIHDTQNNERNIYQTSGEVTTDTSFRLTSGSGATFFGTTPARIVEDSTNTSLLYAKPHKANNDTKNEHGADERQQPDEFLAAAPEQRFTNPVFDSKDASWPTEDRTLAAPVKPVAIVKPISYVPRKPQPYKPKSERTSNTYRIHGIQTPTPSPAPQETPPVHPDDDTPSGTHVNSHDGIYAQVSAPLSQSSNDSQRPDDIIAYAELDLRSETTEDGGQPSSSSQSLMYATVMKKK